MLGLQCTHHVRGRPIDQQLHRPIHPKRVLVGIGSAAGHQPVEYYTSRQTPPARATKRPLKLEVRDCVGAVISPLLANVYLDRLDREWQAHGCGTLVRYADDLVVMCGSEREARRALRALRVLLAELGLRPKETKTRIVHLREGGEGFDFLGFHHRYVRGRTPRSRHLTFLARWPSRQAMQHARDRIHELTDRRRLLVPVEEIVQDVNRFLRGWAGYFRHGNSARHFAVMRTYATDRLALFVAKRHRRARSYGWRAVVYRSPDRYGLINLNGSVVAPRPNRPWREKPNAAGEGRR
jgi:Reverse transcriptase (RNA-dependent DNA polymerase)/Group II intron, maturase-specific domain